MKTKKNPFETRPALQRSGLVNQVASDLEKKIITQELAPGEKLPSERDLCVYFGVSRVTIRDAIRLLEQRSLIEKRNGSGNYARAVSYDSVGDTVERFFIANQCSYDELLETRELIEPKIAALAARRANAEDLEILEQCASQIEQDRLEGDPSRAAESDIAFHQALANSCGNSLLYSFIVGIHRLIKRSIMEQNRRVDLEQGTHGHRAIFAAVKDRDPKRAFESMQGHMKIARQAYMNSVEEHDRSHVASLSSSDME